MKPPLTLQQLLNRAEVAAAGAGREALSLIGGMELCDDSEIGIQRNTLFRFLVARGAAK